MVFFMCNEIKQYLQYMNESERHLQHTNESEQYANVHFLIIYDNSRETTWKWLRMNMKYHSWLLGIKVFLYLG